MDPEIVASRHHVASQARRFERLAPTLAVGFAPVLVWFAIQQPVVAMGALGALMVWRWPVHAFLAVLILVEEETVAGTSKSQAGPLLEAGSATLYQSKIGPVPVLAAFLVIAAIAALRRSMRIDRLTWFLASGIAVYCFFLAALQGKDMNVGKSASLPFIELVLASMIGAAVRSSDKSSLLIWIGGLFSIKAVQGLLAFATGQGLPGDGAIRVVFYDSTLSTLAVTAALASWSFTRDGTDWRSGARRVLAWSATLVVFCALRRNAIAGGLMAVAALGLLGREWKSVRRLGFAGSSIMLGLAFANPTFVNSLFSSFSSAWRSVNGSVGAVDSSSAGHANDISLGLRYVREWGVSGAGIDSPALPGMVLNHIDALYVHNEFLQDWLRLGLAGAVAASVIVLLGLLRSLRTLNRRRTDILDRFAACFLIAQPLTLWFFPHLSTLQRWPSMVGFFMGLLWASQKDSRKASRPPSRLESPEGATNGPPQ